MPMQPKTRFFYIKTVIPMVLAAVFCINLNAEDSWTKEREKAKAIVTNESLAREISFLTDSLCHGRATGTKGAFEAAMWIRRKFETTGLIPVTETYTSGFDVRDGIRGHNVAGMLPAAISIPCDRYVIIGAHYDHIGTLDGKMYPGADANASGVIAMTSLAEMFSSMRKTGKIYDSNIIFVAFDANEFNMKGSEALWEMLGKGMLKNPLTEEIITSDQVTLMVNIDQIGSSLSPVTKGRNDYIIMLGTSSLQQDRQDLLHTCNLKENINMEIGLDYYGSTNFTEIFYRLSDQKVFVDNNKPAVMFTSGITMNNNKTWDRTENLNLNILQKRIYLMYHWIEKML